MNEKQKWLDWAVELHRAAISAADIAALSVPRVNSQP